MKRALQSFQAQSARARARFLALQVRERWIVGVGAVVMLFVVLYLAVWEPLTKAHVQREAALASARSTAIRLEEAAAKLQTSAGRNPAATAGRGLSLMAAVDQASKQGSLGKEPTRIQPEGDREVRVWFEDVSFDSLVRWLSDLQTRYGVAVQTLEVEPQATPGKVNVRLSLVRAS
ncbi:type II secretion system protein M (GspM) [Panacagrimonas perspica]|uniref:Type II secretion system protein M n=1 Tax=Panacagrimonas perspica TaxID=381431 RepID=A0A4R7PBW0_9GAMM|nr:type II secretion system protein M [Panacagrimonas perspica]TDU31584.1 type II secretion system protein M (GspM) [Panacagrimonas perspica]THD03186.1 hypothetical protein B1810_11475 [Panacagrimonas perspica]